MGRIKNKDLYLLKYLPQATDYVVGSDEENNGETVNFELGALTALVQNYGQSDRIISGKAIWIPGTLSFYIQEIEYYLRGEFHTTDPITITLATADPSNPRKDVIAVTIDEEVYVETGTPSPDPAKPTLPNGTDYLELTFVDIAAGATIPTGAEYETIYANFLGEPTEWTTTENTGGSRIILNDDVFVNSSPVSISMLSPNDGDTITFTNDSPFVLDPNDNFQFYVRSPYYLSTLRTFGSLKIRFYKSGSPVSNYITLRYPASNSISTFYPVSVALDKFTFSDTSYDRVDIEMYGIDFDFRIDDVGIVRNINDPLDGDFVPTGGYEGTGQDLYTLIYNHINDTTIHFTQAQISITESQISDLQAYLLTETDPIFGAHTVSNIVNGTGRLTNDGAGNWSYDNNSYSLASHTHSLIDLTDVNTSTPTNRNVLVADGIDWESRLLVEADISDLQNYALESSLIIPNTEIVFGTGTGITSSTLLTWGGTGLLSLGTIAATGNLFGANLILSSANPDIVGNDVDGDLSIYASTASLSGGEIKLYGESHATKANDVEFLSNGFIKGSWDNSANLWSFVGNVQGTSFIKTGGLSTQFLKADGSVDSNSYALASAIQDWLRADVADVKTAGALKFNDNVQLDFGTDADTDLYFDGLNTYFRMSLGDLFIQDAGVATRFTLGRTTGNLTNTGTITSQGTGDSSFVGNLVIGATSSNQKFEVYETDTTLGAGIGAFKFSAVSNYVTSKNLFYHRQDVNQIVVNEDGVDLDFRIEGDTDVNLFKVDAGTDRVGIGIATPLYKLDVAGTVRSEELILDLTDIGTINVGTQTTGYINFGNISGSTNAPTMSGKSNDNTGIQILGATNNSNTSGDIIFNVRENDNTDFATLTSKAFVWSRFATELANLTRNGNLTTIGTMTATNFILSSDERLKTFISPIQQNKININWKEFELKEDLGQKRYGVIAQELEVNHPEFVRTNEEGIKSVAYIDLLVAKIAELEQRLEKAGI